MRTKFTLIICAVLFSVAGFAQESTVTLKTTGSAETKEKAVQYALRSAIEQAFGAFISSNTEILNDELVADEITSVASGNIEKYDILSETVNEAGNSWFVTTNVIVSVGKLTEFVQAQGVEVEIKGGMYAINIKQQQLNEESEYISILNFYKVFHDQMLNAFDYTLDVGSPTEENITKTYQRSSNSNQKTTGQNWNISMDVTTKTNDNMAFCETLLYSTLEGLSMTDEEVKNYKSLGKEVHALSFLDREWPKFQLNAIAGVYGSSIPQYTTIYNGDTVQCDKDGLILQINPLPEYYLKALRFPDALIKYSNKGGHMSSIISAFPYLTKKDIISANQLIFMPKVKIKRYPNGSYEEVTIPGKYAFYDAEKDQIAWTKFLSSPHADNGKGLYLRIPTRKKQVFYLRNPKSAALINKIINDLQGGDEMYGRGFDIVSELAEYKSNLFTKKEESNRGAELTTAERASALAEYNRQKKATEEEESNKKVKITFQSDVRGRPSFGMIFNYSQFQNQILRDTYTSRIESAAIGFPGSGTTICQSSFTCTLTLEQLESLKKFEVKKSDH